MKHAHALHEVGMAQVPAVVTTLYPLKLHCCVVMNAFSSIKFLLPLLICLYYCSYYTRKFFCLVCWSLKKNTRIHISSHTQFHLFACVITKKLLIVWVSQSDSYPKVSHSKRVLVLKFSCGGGFHVVHHLLLDLAKVGHVPWKPQ